MKGFLLLGPTFAVLASAVNCNGNDFDLTVDNWNSINADSSLRAFWDGGVDGEGVTWPGKSAYSGDGESDGFTTQLGIQLQNKNTWNCSGLPWEDNCAPVRCTGIGQHDNHGTLTSAPSRWGLLALNSLSNLHKWISTLYDGIGIGQGSATDYSPQIAIDFIKPKTKPPVFSFKDIFAAAGAAFGLLGGLPAARYQPFKGPASTITSLIGAELGLHLPTPDAGIDSDQTAAAYSQALANFADGARQSLEVSNDQVFNSEDDTTLNLLTGGTWVQSPSQTETDYGVFVYYVWLNDVGAVSGQTGTKCDLDTSGPQHAKFCANEGVYYLYLWDGSSLQWPYGGWKLQPAPYNINPVWAAESSARSFKAQCIDYDPTKTDQSQLLGAADTDDFISSPERLEGTRTLPVCDGSSYGQFNYDYEQAKNGDTTQPPCSGGLNGKDTATFVDAAKMDAKKIARSCFNWWVVQGTANWPSGTDRIYYGLNNANVVTKGGVDKCRHDSGASDPKYCSVD